MFSLGRRKPLVPVEQNSWKIVKPADPMEHVTYIAIPECDLPALVKRYAKAMEVEESQDWCTCQWIIHPDDVNVKANECRVCQLALKSQVHKKGSIQYIHQALGRRMRLGDQSPDCPAHTKEGLLLYFFRWVFNA